MKKNDESVLWVVYRMTINGKPSQMNAVCEQNEWDAMESARPGYHTLVQAGIANEGEAERLARSTPPDQGILTHTPQLFEDCPVLRGLPGP
jgi:hypothetical protein